MKKRNINEELMDAVSGYDLQAVKNCLESGADPNYTLFKDEVEPDGLIQPTTPLRLVLFRISDCMLDDYALKQFTKIAKLLLSYGADPKPAMQIAEARYGKYNPEAGESLFMDVWRVVAAGIKE